MLFHCYRKDPQNIFKVENLQFFPKLVFPETESPRKIRFADSCLSYNSVRESLTKDCKIERILKFSERYQIQIVDAWRHWRLLQ